LVGKGLFGKDVLLGEFAEKTKSLLSSLEYELRPSGEFQRINRRRWEKKSRTDSEFDRSTEDQRKSYTD
jgi:hypothetical protein